MVALQSALLALPPPGAATAGLRAQLRGAAAIPVQPVEPARSAADASFGTTVRTARAPRPVDGQADIDWHSRGRAPQDWLDPSLLEHPFGPFLAQQLGQGARLVAPTLAASAEVAAYAAAQQRAEFAAAGSEPTLDIHA